jgi:hypothetical protein
MERRLILMLIFQNKAAAFFTTDQHGLYGEKHGFIASYLWRSASNIGYQYFSGARANPKESKRPFFISDFTDYMERNTDL